jgi:ceramide glucosyltransferase
MSAPLAALYLLLLLARAALALRHAARFTGTNCDLPYTIVQPILSGDPRLAQTLAANLAAHPAARFLWLIDEDDHEAHQIASSLLSLHPHLHVVSAPGPADGENPKMAKLIRALPLVDTPRLIVLDDDTFLPASSQLPPGPLVTGLPVFSSRGTIYERLIGGFVNGNALLTYLPAAHLNLQKTINGMIYAVDTRQLRHCGGFAAAGHSLTDDRAIARLFHAHGHPVIQSATPALVAITVSGPRHYIQIMHRWMIFATHYFRENATAATLFWTALPGLLPWLGLASGSPSLWFTLFFTKAAINRLLLWRITGIGSSLPDLVFEVGADLTTPIWMMLACLSPRRLTWRRRRIELCSTGIRYR